MQVEHGVGLFHKIFVSVENYIFVMDVYDHHRFV